jgi:hypothetical protein
MIVLIVLVWLLNFGISVWNAYAVGRAWVETKVAGGWPRFMAWMGALMSASGFSWCYLIVLAFGAHVFGWFSEEALDAAFNLGYILLIPGILFSGLMIMLDSWRRAFRNGGILNYGVAAYNTYAQVHNTLSAFQSFGSAASSVFDFLKTSRGDRHVGSSDDDNGKGLAVLLVVIVVAVALLAGVLSTAIIIRWAAGSDSLPPLRELEDRRRVAHGA